MIPVAFAVQAIYTMYAVYTMAAIMMITYAAASSSQARSAQRSAQDAAMQDYYRQVQKGQTDSRVFKASQASARDARMNAIKYTGASEQLANEATAREKASREQPGQGYRPRSTAQRLKDFGNEYGRFIDVDLETPVLLATEDMMKYNFDVQNFNINYLEEA